MSFLTGPATKVPHILGSLRRLLQPGDGRHQTGSVVKRHIVRVGVARVLVDVVAIGAADERAKEHLRVAVRVLGIAPRALLADIGARAELRDTVLVFVQKKLFCFTH